MIRLIQPLIPLLCETGASMDSAWMSELAKLSIAKRKREGTIPFEADLRWWFCEKQHDGILLEAVKDVDLSKIFPNGVSEPSLEEPMEPVPGVDVKEIWSGEPIRYINGGYPGKVQTIEIHTPLGTIRGAAQYAERSFGVIEYPVKRPEDLAIVRHIYQKRAEAAKPDIRGIGVLPMVAFQSYLIQWTGVQNAVYFMMDAPEEIENTVWLVESLYEPVIELLAKKYQWVSSCENLSSDISTPYWEKYVGKQLKRRTEIAARYNAKWDIHLDGVVMPLLGKLADKGIGGVNGLTASPSGDLDPLRFREAAGPDIRLKDILPQIIFVPEAFSESQFDEYVRQVVDFYKDDGNVILGIGDMLPANGSLKRVEKVIDLIEERTS